MRSSSSALLLQGVPARTIKEPGEPLKSWAMVSFRVTEIGTGSHVQLPGVIPYSIPVLFPAPSLFVPCYELALFERKAVKH
jgi:hypothetical protein